MRIPERKRTCFVVMPFGEKRDLDGNAIDFDDVYRFFFKKAIEDLGIDCIRCDEIEETGSIHEKMFEHIYRADIVVVDISTSNANVYYELGIRHALARGVTVLIRRKGTIIPFNIQGLQVVEYDQGKFSSIEQAKVRIHQMIHNGLFQKRNDSPVHAVLDLNIEPEGSPIEKTEFLEWRFADNDAIAVGLVTGDLQNVTGIDVWVNPENTSMQMARPFENSVSGIIRYLGAEKDAENGQIKTDTIAKELEDRMNGRTTVDPATVLVTTSGAMENTHKVKRIFHAAANYGQVGQGYIPIDHVARCVMNALKTSAEDAQLSDDRSILFPLMATRSRKGTVLEERVKPLLNAAIDYLARNSQKTFRKVYFLTYTDKELEVCRDLLNADDRLKTLDEIPASSEDLAVESRVSKGPASATLSAPMLPRSGTASLPDKNRAERSKIGRRGTNGATSAVRSPGKSKGPAAAP